MAPPAAPGSYLHAVERYEGPRPRIELFAAGSVYDELRGVLRRAMELGARWDEVEIIAADPALYGSALHALADPLEIPVTFAVGLPVSAPAPVAWSPPTSSGSRATSRRRACGPSSSLGT